MLSDHALRARLRGKTEDGNDVEPLILSPLLDSRGNDGGAIQGCSVDLRLGTWFETPRLHARVAHGLRSPGPPTPGEERSGKSVYVPFGVKFFLHPGNFVLAVSL